MNRAATIALAPLSLLYGAAMSTRSALYRRQTFRADRVAAPVISVGNITTGGTGKSPLVAWIARELSNRGRRVCILTRGYGRSNQHQRVVVSDGQEILSDVAHASDEPMMLAEALRGRAAIVCDADRVSAATWAIENLNSDVLILDDGFQHQRISRDLDIVTVDATNPFGNGWLLPAGDLREPVGGLRRANCIVTTRTGAVEPTDLYERLAELTDAPILKSRTAVTAIRALNPTQPIDEHFLRNTALAAFCGIGNPNAFFEQLRNEGLNVQYTAAFRDHHVYSQTDIDHLTRESREHGAQVLLTTTKDAVKLRELRFELPCYVVETEMEIARADKLLSLIDNAIARQSRS
jgi:tetraacyldisaccharide 4'-kinase